MPRWPAYLMAGIAAACAVPAITTPPPVKGETYSASGSDGAWTLSIGNGRIDYVNRTSADRITVGRPEPQQTLSGRRYETANLMVDIAYEPCFDEARGALVAHQVMVVAESLTWRGCGGARWEPDQA